MTLRRTLPALLENFILTPAHILFLISLGAAFITLRRSTDFNFHEFFDFSLYSFIFSVPLGWLIVKLCLPDLYSMSARAAFIIAVGYCASALTGFFVTSIGGRNLYLAICLIGGAIALAWSAVEWFRLSAQARRESLSRLLDATVNNATFWILLSLCLLAVIVIYPLMTPLRQITPTEYLDYTDIDGFYHSARVQLFQIQAPLLTSPDLSGIKPQVYPDLHHFWIGQISAWTTGGPRKAYIVYAPAILVIAGTIVLYAAGKALTQSAWGGLVAAALGYVILLPNPYDSTFFLRESQELITNWNAERMRFVDLRFGLSYGVSWLILTAIVLALALYRTHKSSWTGIALLSLAAFVIAPLLRIRPHHLMVFVPVYGLILFYLLIRERKLRYLIPFLVLVSTTGALYLESTSSNYELAPVAMGIEYGLFSSVHNSLVPSPLSNLIALLPPLAQPPFVVFFLFALRAAGLFYSLVIGGWIFQLVRTRRRPSLPILFLFGVVFTTWLGVLFIIIEPYRNLGGDWGGQALFILPRVAVLIAIVPLVQWGRALGERIPFFKRNAAAFAIVGLALGVGVTAWGAESTLKSEPLRAYQMNATEFDLYRWLATNTPPTTVIAADTRHPVNAQGETIGNTNFLGGMTERPGYLQRTFINNTIYPAETQRRQQYLDDLLAAETSKEMRALLQNAPFDYWLVYADATPKTNPACCMLELRAEFPRLYQVIR